MASPASVIRSAKVVAVHPESHSVDIVLMDTGACIPNVPVLSRSASTNSGVMDLHVPTPSSKPYDPTATNDRDVYAYVASCNGRPVVIGFMVPEVTQMTFADKGRRIDRHASDFYSSLDDDGNFELYHPSGTFLRLGVASAHEDLTGKDFDQRWKIARNTDKQVHVHLEVAHGGSTKATVDIDPTGKITITNGADIDITTTANINTQAAQWTHTGPLTVNGAVAVNSHDVTVTGGDVVADGKHLKTHTHSGVTAGSSNSGPPN